MYLCIKIPYMNSIFAWMDIYSTSKVFPRSNFVVTWRSPLHSTRQQHWNGRFKNTC